MTELDFMEYANDAVAQAAYVASDAEGVNQNYEVNGDAAGAVGDSADVENWYACKFTTAKTIFCSAASIYLEGVVGAPVGDMTFRIETNSGANKPSGTLAHANATGTVTPSQPAWNKCGFTQFELAVGTYWLVIHIDDQATNNRWLWTRDNSGGTNEHAYSTDHAANWTLHATARSYYRIYGIHCQCYSESTIIQQGTYSLKGLAEATDALNDTLTRIVAPTINLSGLTQIKLAVRASRTGSNIKVGIHDSGGVTTEITPNILIADTFQAVTWDISAVVNANKDVIDSIIITIVNADADNTFYIDNMYAESLANAIFLGCNF